MAEVIFTRATHYPMTTALEARIQNGVGFTNQSYDDQREHWLAWIENHRRRHVRDGRDWAIEPARSIWSRVHSAPALFWLAESVGADNAALVETANAVALVVNVAKKGPPAHGACVRRMLPWEALEKALHGIEAIANIDHVEFAETCRVAGDRLEREQPAYKV